MHAIIETDSGEGKYKKHVLGAGAVPLHNSAWGPKPIGTGHVFQ